MAADRQELGMKAGISAMPVKHSRFEIVDNKLTRRATEEGQRIGNRSLVLGLALRKRELVVHHSAVTQHRDLA